MDADLHERFERVLEPDLRARRSELAEIAATRGSPSAATWERYATAKAASDSLLGEAHDFMQGALIRQAKVDDGLCVLADRLLDGISDRCGIPWGRLSVPADSEFVSDLAQIVRLRAGDVSVWHLPVAAHEFGHFVGPLIQVAGTHPFADRLARQPKVGSYGWSRAHELFADAFATYAIGPSFLAACVISRFDPHEARTVSETHPSHLERVWFMRRLASEIDGQAPGRPWSAILTYLADTWRINLSTAGVPGDEDGIDTARLEEDALDFLAILRAGVPAAVYSGITNARRSERIILGQHAALPPEATIADVLNGAWLSRLDRPITDVAGLRKRGEVALRLARGASGG